MQAQGAIITGEEGGVESEFSSGVDVLEGIVSEVEGFRGSEALLLKSLAQDPVKGSARLGCSMLVGKEAEVRSKTKVAEFPSEKGREKPWSVELGVGDDPEG